MAAVGDPIYAVRAEAVPMVCYAHQVGREFRIRFSRGIGWAPQKFKTRDEVLRVLLGMRGYTVEEARMVKAMCTPNP